MIAQKIEAWPIGIVIEPEKGRVEVDSLSLAVAVLQGWDTCDDCPRGTIGAWVS